MLYYTSLFLIIVLVSIIAIWMYRAILGASRVTHTAILPGRRKVSARAKARLKSRRKQRGKGKTTTIGRSEVPTPWGWKDTPHAANTVHKPGSDKVLWSGPSSHHGVSEPATGQAYSAPAHSAATKRVGWPYREDKLAFAGKAYKVNRKAAENGELEGKPWVW